MNSKLDQDISKFIAERPWIKLVKLGEHIGVRKQSFYQYLRGKRSIPEPKRYILMQYLSTVGFKHKESPFKRRR